MFASEMGSIDDAALIAVIEDGARAEAAAAARRLAAIAELTARHTEPDDERRNWLVDGWACAAAEIAAALGIGTRAASREMRIAETLRERLPRVAALFSAGLISAQLVAVITWRTQLVVDHRIAARIDAVIAERATTWGTLSATKLDNAIDTIVDAHDPDARRRLREAVRERDMQVGKPDDETGTASVFGRLLATDAALLDRRLAQMAGEVCDADPRTVGQRRSDAVGVIAAGGHALACRCGRPECAAAGDDARANAFIINILADPAVLSTEPDPDLPGDDHTASERAPAAAFVLGGAVIPAPLLADLIKGGAAVRTVQTPGPDASPGYRLSPRRERFVRMRDMTCRFPGCERPAEYCDVDHTVPYPVGPTHPSNTKCLCRLHHLLKTFCGWRDRQTPDGTVTWTAPSGRSYSTHPASRILFPDWDTTTAQLPPATAPSEACDKTLKMPRRRRTRAAEYTARLKSERALNSAARQPVTDSSAATRPPPSDYVSTPRDDIWSIGPGDTTGDPPPF